VATFYGLTLDKLGSGYTLSTANSSLGSATSAAFDATDELVFIAKPPSIITIGIPFGFVVAAEDGYGNVDTSYNDSVSVTDWWGTLGGTTTATAINGVATFSGLTLSHVSSYEYLYVTADGLPSVLQRPIQRSFHADAEQFAGNLPGRRGRYGPFDGRCHQPGRAVRSYADGRLGRWFLAAVVFDCRRGHAV